MAILIGVRWRLDCSFDLHFSIHEWHWTTYLLGKVSPPTGSIGVDPLGLDGVVIQSVSRVWLFATPWTLVCQASLSFTTSCTLLKVTSIELVMPSSHLIFCCSLLLLPSVFPSIRIFSSESALRMRWPKYWRISISLSNECSGLISFRIDRFDFLAVQGTLKSLLAPQFKSINSLALSLLYGPTLTSMHGYWKNHNFDYMDLWLADLSLVSFLGHSQEEHQGALMGREQKHKIHKKNSKSL